VLTHTKTRLLLFCGCCEQIAEDIVRDARSLALHTKDLVVIETKTGCLETLTLDFDNSETSTDLHCITQVTCRTTLTLTPVLRSVLVEYCVLYCRVFVVELSPSWVPIVWILVITVVSFFGTHC